MFIYAGPVYVKAVTMEFIMGLSYITHTYVNVNSVVISNQNSACFYFYFLIYFLGIYATQVVKNSLKQPSMNY